MPLFLLMRRDVGNMFTVRPIVIFWGSITYFVYSKVDECARIQVIVRVKTVKYRSSRL